MNSHCPWIVVGLAALVGCASPAGRSDAGGNTSTGGITGTSSGGAGGSGGTSGSGGTTIDPPSDAMPPHYEDGGITPVGATPPAAWTNVTANLAGLASECGNTPYL